MIVLLLLVATAFALTDIDKFNKFKQEFGRKYANPSEERLRFEIFKKNVRKIEELNAKRTKNSDAHFGINKFTDKLPEELPISGVKPIKIEHEEQWKQDFKLVSDAALINRSYDIDTPEDNDLPKFFSYCGDYVQNNTNGLKVDLCGQTYDQANCGSCYAASQANLAQYFYANQSYNSNNGTAEKPFFGIQYYLNNTAPYIGTNNRCCGGNPITIYGTAPFYFLESEAPYMDSNNLKECYAAGVKFRPKTKMAVRKYQTFSVTQVGGKSEQIEELKKDSYSLWSIYNKC